MPANHRKPRRLRSLARARQIGPIINGTTLTQSLRQALLTGQVNKVPVIAGTDRDEDLMGVATPAASYTHLVE